jgi:hypothetical protein
MLLQNPYMILIWILDMLLELKESFYINYLVILINLPR